LGIEQVPESLSVDKYKCITDSLELTLVTETGDYQEIPRQVMAKEWGLVRKYKYNISDGITSGFVPLIWDNTSFNNEVANA
jgi:hypothetical protein